MSRLRSPSGKPSGVAGRAGLSCVLGLVCAGTASAQSASFSLVPSVAISETLTDNRELGRGEARKGDLITQISPGVSLTARRGPLQGVLNYSLSGLVYARATSENSVQHQLQANGQLVALDGRLGVNASASAGMQTISAYGTQSADPALNNGNQTQTFSYSLAPYLTGRLLGDAAYRMQLVYDQTRTGNSGVGNAASLNGSLGFNGRMGVIGWSVDANRQISETGDRSRSHIGGVTGGLAYSPDVDWQFSARAGSENSDVMTGRSERTTTWGAGVTWQPGPRTTLRASYDHRYFGRSHAFSLSHRTASTVWSLSDSRNINMGSSTGRAVVTLYDLLYAMTSPNKSPAERDAEVRARLGNQDPTQMVVVGGFLNSSPTLQRQQSLTVAYIGLRSTLSVGLTKSSSNAVGSIDAAAQAQNSPGQIGLSVAWTHRLTPEASLSVSASQQHTKSNGVQASNDLRTITATWSSRLGPYSNVSLGLRHAQFDSETSPYTESAVLGSIRMQF